MEQTNSGLKKYPTIGVCGLDCGLCPRYYTDGSSRCPGCGGVDFSEKHPSCSFITCCVKKKNLEVCGECDCFPCSKFQTEEEYQQVKESSSYPSYKKAMSNLKFIKEHGIEKFTEQQAKRIKLLETMIENFNDGRSRSFFCKKACLLEIPDLEKSLARADRQIETEQTGRDDFKNKAGILRAILAEFDF